MEKNTQLKILYTTRAKFDQSGGDGWDSYVNWARLPQLRELVSTGSVLNEILVEGDRESADFWNHVAFNGSHESGFFTSEEFVLNNMEPVDSFNLLAVSMNPEINCDVIELEDYEFLGYDLLDQYGDISALTNCGGFDEAFLPSELNQFGLIDKYNKAIDIHNGLLEKYPDEEHADTNIIAIWRHKIIGVPKG